ncbi:MAG TPA: EpsI family protein [Methylophilaceae bacterium]|jgi:EpsI family protein
MSELVKISFGKSLLLAILMAIAAMGAVYAKPKLQAGKEAPSLESIVPHEFGDWHEESESDQQVSLSTDGEKSQDQPYDQVLSRTYVNSSGDAVMLALAYAKEQKQDVKIHRPEVCYVAQGYTLLSKNDVGIFLSPNMPTAQGKRLLTKRDGRIETVSYWVRVGNEYPRGGLDARMVIFKDGLKGKIDDGILVRASIIIPNEASADEAFEKQERFMADLVRTVELTAPGVLTKNKND